MEKIPFSLQSDEQFDGSCKYSSPWRNSFIAFKAFSIAS